MQWRGEVKKRVSWLFVIELDPFVRIACGIHVADEIVETNIERGTVIVRMEGEMGVVLQVLVEKDVDVVVYVVDKPKRADGAGTETKVLLHSPLRGQTELALMKKVLQVVDTHMMVALEDNQIVAVALMVAEKKVLAMGAGKITPIRTSILNSRGGRVLGICKVNAKFPKTFVY